MKPSIQGYSVIIFAFLAVSASAGIPCAAPISQQRPSLILVGPVESISVSGRFSIVLGQKIPLGPFAVGDTVTVFGNTHTDGGISVSSVERKGPYVAGATKVILTGSVEKVDVMLGRAVVNGVLVDLTPTLSNGTLSVRVGSVVQIAGIQPIGGQLVVAESIRGGGESDQSIVGGSVSLSGINGGGKSDQSIIGGSAALNGINGGGQSAQSISGGGLQH